MTENAAKDDRKNLNPIRRKAPIEQDHDGDRPDYICGLKAAILFNHHGIPVKSVIPNEFMSNDWVQVSVQTLSLNFCFHHLFPTEEPTYCISYRNHDAIVILKSSSGYIAFLLDKRIFPSINHDVLSWLRSLDADCLKIMLSA